MSTFARAGSSMHAHGCGRAHLRCRPGRLEHSRDSFRVVACAVLCVCVCMRACLCVYRTWRKQTSFCFPSTFPTPTGALLQSIQRRRGSGLCVCLYTLTMALAQGLDLKQICLKIILVSLGAVCIRHKSLKVSRLTGTRCRVPAGTLTPWGAVMGCASILCRYTKEAKH